MSQTPKSKSDQSLGQRVHEHLLGMGLETPSVPSDLTNETKIAEIEIAAANILNTLGLDLKDDSLCETPARIAKMFVNELFWGLNYDNFPKATVVENKFSYDEIVLERNITVYSTCEHHLLPIMGHAHIAYIPNEKVVGLSKLNRIVEFFARRPQIQERLTAQIAETLKFLLGTENVAVCLDAEHLCVKTRGVEDACSDTVTSKLGGVFKTNPAVRAEFFSLIKL